MIRNFARIHWQNLVNFGILPLEFTDDSDYESIEQGDVLAFGGLRSVLQDGGDEITVENATKSEKYALRHRLSKRQAEMVLAGGLIPVFRRRLAGA